MIAIAVEATAEVPRVEEAGAAAPAATGNRVGLIPLPMGIKVVVVVEVGAAVDGVNPDGTPAREGMVRAAAAAAGKLHVLCATVLTMRYRISSHLGYHPV